MFDFLKKPQQPQRSACLHDWNAIAKTYAPPISSERTIEDIKLLERALFGVTTIIFKCSACGEIEKQEMVGSDENRWHEIIERVERNGIQYIKEGGKVYGVAEWVPPKA